MDNHSVQRQLRHFTIRCSIGEVSHPVSAEMFSLRTGGGKHRNHRSGG